MATLDGSSRAVTVGLGITLRAPGLRGSAEVHNIATGSPTRAAEVDGSGPALERALAEQGFLRLRVIELDVAPTPHPPSGEVRSPGSDLPGLEVSVPDLGGDVAQVLLAVDEHGVATWNFPVDSGGSLAPTHRGSGGEVRFIVPAFSSGVPAPGTPGQAGTRGVLGLLGRKVLELVALPLGRLVAPPLALHAAKAWESSARVARARTYTVANRADAAAPDLTDEDWARLASGRSLWFVHGTFATSHGTFSVLPEAMLAALSAAYGGRVAALDHHTLGLTPLENVAALKAMMPAGLQLDVDLVCHSRGGLVSRALAGQSDADTPFNVRRLVHVATPNHGTALATPSNLVAFIDRITTIANLAPDGVLDAAAGVLTSVLVVVKVIAKYGVTAIPGLESMDADGDFLASFNAAPVAAEQYAIAADFTPAQGLWSLTAKAAENLLVDRVFGGAANDLVVPTAGVYEGSAGVDIPPGRRVVLPTSRAVYHGSFFSQPDVAAQIADWLTD